MNINQNKIGFDGARAAIEDYYKNLEMNKSNRNLKNEPLIVIFFENIEHLFEKKKQVLFYILLEILTISSNIFLCGMTANHDLMNQMEKRVKSRFSNKTIFIKVPEVEQIMNALEESVNHITNDNIVPEVSSLQTFYKILIETNNINNQEYNIVILFEKYVNLGMSIKEIITKMKYILILIMIQIKNDRDRDIYGIENKLQNIISDVLIDYIKEETDGSFFNLLKNFPKFHIILLICLWRCVGKYKTKITIGMIYQEYSDFCQSKNYKQNTGGLNKNKLDLVIVKKAFEELLNSNLISIKEDDKYVQVYELKLPFETTQKVLMKLDTLNIRNFDTEMKNLVNVKFN